MNRVPCFLLLPGLLMACSSVQPRPAHSSYGCMQAVRAQLPTDDNDKRLHCLATAQITRQCSVSEAYLAGMGKELSDLFGSGDAEWADWQADRAGVNCGRAQNSMEDIQACCAAKGY
jgi:hypothetical protein